jgi:hypothetical protein
MVMMIDSVTISLPKRTFVVYFLWSYREHSSVETDASLESLEQ